MEQRATEIRVNDYHESVIASRNYIATHNSNAMPARIHKIRHDEETRAKIRAAQIINRLQKHIMADKPLMDASQVSAAKTLLGKVLADLQATQHSGPGGAPIEVIENVIVRPANKDG